MTINEKIDYLTLLNNAIIGIENERKWNREDWDDINSPVVDNDKENAISQLIKDLNKLA